MKRTLQLLTVLAIVAIAVVMFAPKEALAAFAPSRFLNVYVLNKLLIGNGVEANAITETGSASLSIDFAATTIVCNDSAGITVTGAVAGDVCLVGAPTTLPANSNFTCYVSAADTVKVRHCPAGTAVSDPAAATYYVRTLSAQ